MPGHALSDTPWPPLADAAVDITVNAAVLAGRLAGRFLAGQPIGAAVLGFLLLYAVLTLGLRLADRIDPPPTRKPQRAARHTATPSPRVWRFRKAA